MITSLCELRGRSPRKVTKLGTLRVDVAVLSHVGRGLMLIRFCKIHIESYRVIPSLKTFGRGGTEGEIAALGTPYACAVLTSNGICR